MNYPPKKELTHNLLYYNNKLYKLRKKYLFPQFVNKYNYLNFASLKQKIRSYYYYVNYSNN